MTEPKVSGEQEIGDDRQSLRIARYAVNSPFPHVSLIGNHRGEVLAIAAMPPRGVPSFPPMTVELTHQDREMLDGGRGEATALAMRIVVDMAGVWQADRLIDVTSAHVDSCLYHGRAGLDFAEKLLAGGASVAVPTTLNVSSLDLLHPDLVRLDADTASRARRLMDAYVAMGCRPTWTCAPYQLEARPAFGEHVAWAESNAIVFANSVLGARTNRYGDFIDICAAVTGRVPEAGLHLDEHRRGRIVFRLADDIPARLLHDEITPTCVGHIVGAGVGNTRARHRRAPARDERRSTESARRRCRVLGRRRDVPRGGDHARGADARGCARWRPCGARDRRHGSSVCAPPATS